MKPIHAIVILILTSALAMADVKTTGTVVEQFKSLDRDADRLISKEEATADKSLRDRFAAVDSDADGYLEEAEFLARPDNRDFQ